MATQVHHDPQTDLFVYTETCPYIRCRCGAEARHRAITSNGHVVDLRIFPCKECGAGGVESVRRLRREAAEKI